VYKSTLVGRMWCYIGAYMPLLIWGSQWVLWERSLNRFWRQRRRSSAIKAI
jgi:hypothetical protein